MIEECTRACPSVKGFGGVRKPQGPQDRGIDGVQKVPKYTFSILSERVKAVSIVIREMAIADYDEVLALWQASEGIGLSDADSREGIARFLARNPGLSSVVHDGEDLVGAALCGHDGRRGYIHHLAVSKPHRRRGLGRALAEHSLFALRRDGIGKCHIFVFGDNKDAIAFWDKIAWTERVELVMMSQNIGREA